MNREKKILLVAIFFAFTGWLAAAALATSLGALKLQAVSAEKDAAIWKRQAGKAYTELLQARQNTDRSTALIPAGARIDCTMETMVIEGKSSLQCVDGTIYPPQGY